MVAVPTSGEIDLGAGAFVELFDDWLAAADADRYFAGLRETIPWEQGQLMFFGKPVLEPRLSAWFGDRDYVYSGRALRAKAFPVLVRELAERAEASTRARFNSVLLNLYRDGHDSMGLHSDDEPELGSNPLIASVSLGAPRRFVLRPKKNKALMPLDLELPHGSLLTMSGSCQHQFRHGLPKSARVVGARINLTFRWIVAPEPGRSSGRS
jgi:alkylated DNA repair dioxygenase AlkB